MIYCKVVLMILVECRLFPFIYWESSACLLLTGLFRLSVVDSLQITFFSKQRWCNIICFAFFHLIKGCLLFSYYFPGNYENTLALTCFESHTRTRFFCIFCCDVIIVISCYIVPISRYFTRTANETFCLLSFKCLCVNFSFFICAVFGYIQDVFF